MRGKIIFLVLIAVIIVFSSCGKDDITAVNSDVLLYEEPGLVDSAVVTGCYAFTRSHFLNDTFSFSGYRNIRIEFESYSSSDHATVSVLSNNAVVTNEVLYTKNNVEVNSNHSFEVLSPVDTTWLELRLYMNPQVCGENEYKFIRARDLKIFGIK